MEEKLTRREVREGAFLILFQTMFRDETDDIANASIESMGLIKNEDTDEIVNGVTAHIAELDAIVEKYSKTRSTARIPKINMTLLRIALYEMIYCERVPAKVAINEAVELSKKYSYKADSGFINGILNSYLTELGENNAN